MIQFIKLNKTTFHPYLFSNHWHRLDRPFLDFKQNSLAVEDIDL